MSKYVLLISSKDTIEIKSYNDYQTINDLVGGWYEICGFFNKKYMLYCNEEFLFEDKCEFNALATIINSHQPIYGDTVLMADGFTNEGERDSVPMSCEEAVYVRELLYELKKRAALVIDKLHKDFDNNKPKLN